MADDTSNLPEPRQRYYNNDGTVAAGCLLYTYEAGTSKIKLAYEDSAGTSAHPNPLTLDAKGEVLIYWDGAYKVDLKTADGVQITGYPVDNYVSYEAESYPVLGTFTPTAGTGIRTVVGVGFKPRRLDILATNTSTTQIAQNRVAVASDLRCYCMRTAIETSGSLTSLSSNNGNLFLSMINASGVTTYEARFTSFDDDGFTYTCTKYTSAPNVRFVAYP